MCGPTTPPLLLTKSAVAPDQNAFRAFAQKRYLEKYASDWPKGAIDRINAIK